MPGEGSVIAAGGSSSLVPANHSVESFATAADGKQPAMSGGLNGKHA